MTQVIKAATAGDFLALIPSMLGYRPSEDIILVPFHGTRSIGAIRLDLPTDEHEEHGARDAARVVARVDGVDTVAAVVYTERPAGDVVSLLALLGEYLEVQGVEVRDLLFVAGDGYGSINEPGMPLRPVSELAPHLDAPTFAESVLAGTELPDVPDDIIMDTLAAMKRLDVEDYDLVEWIENVLVIGQPDRLAPSDLAYGLVIASRPALRDIMIAQAIGDRAAGQRALDAQLAWEQGVEFPADIAMCMWGEGDQPAPKRLEAVLELGRYLAALSDDPGTYALAAWCSWALGRSTHAEHYAKLGLKINEDHGLCGIVISFVNAGHLPAWAFKRRG